MAVNELANDLDAMLDKIVKDILKRKETADHRRMTDSLSERSRNDAAAESYAYQISLSIIAGYRGEF